MGEHLVTVFNTLQIQEERAPGKHAKSAPA